MSGTQGADLLRAKKASRPKSKKRRRSPLSVRGVAVFVLLALVATIGAFGFAIAWQGDAIAPGVRIGAVQVGGKTIGEAIADLRGRASSLAITYELEGAEAVIRPTGEDKAIAVYRIDDAIADAHSVGREGKALKALADRLNAHLFGRTVPLDFSFDRMALRQALESRFGTLRRPARDARLVVKVSPDGEPFINVTPESEGMDIDFDTVMMQTEERLRTLTGDPIEVPLKKDLPELSLEDIEPLVPQAKAALARTPLTITAKDQTWTVSKSSVADWLAARPTGNSLKGSRAHLRVDPEKVSLFLTNRAKAIAIEAKNAEFEEKDGRVVTFVPGVNGEKVDVELSFKAIETALFGPADAEGPAAITLPMASYPPELTTEASNPYGIKDIIGVGETNFMGSPKNRRHNIGVGAKSLHGLLVAPEEEFSLIKALGRIDGTTGYLQELVIKENRTIPEYGGGLCQIGSTTFRAVLASGLPVTERRNHSYRVPYYERDGDGTYIGPGKDATIYSPAPDFKFRNDTGHHILIQTAVNGNRLTFTFWGVSDGRKAEQTDSRVFDIIAPPPKKIIETTDLPPGKEKCTEKPHPGSKAVFTYTVTYPNGEVKAKDFHSHYRPWQEICLVGVDPEAMAPGSGTGETPVTSADAAGAAGN